MPVSGESASNNELNAVNPPAEAPIPTMVRPWGRFLGSAGFFASRLLSFFVVLGVGDRGDFVFFEVIFLRMVTTFSWTELVTLLFHYTPRIPASSNFRTWLVLWSDVARVQLIKRPGHLPGERKPAAVVQTQSTPVCPGVPKPGFGKIQSDFLAAQTVAFSLLTTPFSSHCESHSLELEPFEACISFVFRVE
jgi:hypothetical protein